MTDEHRSELLANQVRLEGKIDTYNAVLSGKIDTLTARLDSQLKKSNGEIKALFMTRDEHTSKIEDIRVDYVPRSDFNDHRKKNREEHKAMLSAINCVQWKVAKIAGGITLIAFLAGLIIKGIGGL